MTDEVPNGIPIGDDKWILWVDYDPTKEVSGDLLLKPLREILKQLETNCVADCCGLDAFDFTRENVQRASAELADPELSTKLGTVRNAIVASNDVAYHITRTNCSLHRDVLIQLIDHIARNV